MSVYSIVKEEKNKIILDFFVCESFLQFFSQYYIGRIIDWRKIMEEFGYCKNCNEYVPCTIRNKVHIEWYKGERSVYVIGQAYVSIVIPKLQQIRNTTSKKSNTKVKLINA